MASITDRLRLSWNAFINDERQETPAPYSSPYGAVTTYQPQRPKIRIANERSIITSIYATMGLDLATLEFRHTRHDDTDRYLEDIKSGLNDCLSVEANIDQAAQAFMLDAGLTLFTEGVCALVPVDTTSDPNLFGSYDIRTMRVGTITQWYPYQVRVDLYNERRGVRQEIVLDKTNVGIVENPLYTVMNSPNSTLQRLIHKLALLDTVDEASSSGKLDLIIQLPYVIKTEAKRQQAEQRRTDIEMQLKGSQYGIAYADGTEKITQLNRPAENQLLAQIEYLVNLLYSQLGLTPEIMNGTAVDSAMTNYYSRTIEPFATAIVQAMRRSFLTKTARSQGQSIDFFRDPLKLVPLSQIADIADKLARNEVLTSNEIRQGIGYKPSNDPKADQLVNSNMPQADTGVAPAGNAPTDAPLDDSTDGTTPPPVDSGVSSGGFDDINAAVSHAFQALGISDDSAAAFGSTITQNLDPSVMNTSLDEIEAAVDSAFSGLGLDDGDS